MPGAQPRQSAASRVASSARRQAGVGLGTPAVSRVTRKADATPTGGAAAATSGLILDWSTQFEMTAWSSTVAAPDETVEWGGAAPTYLAPTAFDGPGATLGAGVWAFSFTVDAFVPSGYYVNLSLSYKISTPTSLQMAPVDTIMGIGSGPHLWGNVACVGLPVLAGDSVTATLVARDSSGVSAPSGIYVDNMQFTAVRLSD